MTLVDENKECAPVVSIWPGPTYIVTSNHTVGAILAPMGTSASYKKTHILKADSQITNICGLGDGYFAGGSEDGALPVWRIGGGAKSHFKPMKIMSGHSATVNVSPYVLGSKFCSFSCDKTVKIWEWSKKKALATKNYNSPLTCCKWTDYVYAGNSDGCVSSWDLANDDINWEKFNDEPIKCIDSQEWYVAVAYGNSCLREKNIMKIYDKREADAFLESYQANVTSLAWKPDNKTYLATGGYDGTVKLWDLRKFTEPIASHLDVEMKKSVFSLEWWGGNLVLVGDKKSLRTISVPKDISL